MPTLYRAVSVSELQDIFASGRLRPIPSSIEGKWFAETPSDAASWGTWFGRVSGVPHEHVVRVTFPERMDAHLLRLTMLDKIGPARFATIQQLQEVEEISLWPSGQS